METRANYVLIGAATLAGIVAAFAFFLWYARVSLDRQFDYYDIRFDQVSGLSRAAEVRFNGILVGQVLSIDLSLSGAQVRVSIEVQQGTPINSETVATLGAQGVTGVSYVSLAGGDPEAPLLEPDPVTGRLIIPSAPSAIESIIEGAPQLLAEARDLLRELSAVASPDNRARVAGILANVEAASGGLETALRDFSAISGSVRAGVDQISAFTGRLDGIATQTETTLKTADAALASATVAFDEAKGALGSATLALDAAKTTFERADTLIAERAPALVDSYEEVAQTASTTIADLGARGAGLVGRLDAAADLASARLRDAEAPIAAVAPALAAVEGAAAGLDRLVTGDGAAAVAAARTALDQANRILETDAPLILADVRTAAATVNRVVGEVGDDATAFSGRLDGVAQVTEATLADAGAAFRSATATLESLQPAVGGAERTLAAAESAFASADRVMNAEVEPTAADLRRAIGRADAAIAEIAADLPAITAEVRAVAEAAGRAAARFETMIARSAPPVEDFASVGLPQFGRLAADARLLVAALEKLTQRIERDPARFFLGGAVPEYRQ